MLRIIFSLLLVCTTSAVSAWEYRTQTDGMRGIEIRVATKTSETTAYDRFGRPAFLKVTLRDWPGEGRAAMLNISNGTFDCYRGCRVSAKFDEGDIITYTATQGGSGNSDWLFIKERQGFERRSKEASKLILEVPLRRAGAKQFSFDIDGLEWP